MRKHSGIDPIVIDLEDKVNRPAGMFKVQTRDSRFNINFVPHILEDK